MEKTDEQILDAFIKEATREQAFGWLLQKYQQRLYWQIRRMVIVHDDADDVIQNVMMKVWRHLGGFKRNSSLHTWLYRISVNESLAFLEKKKKHLTVSLEQPNSEEEDNGPGLQIAADPWFNGEDLERKLQQAILKLPDKQRLVFNLRYYDEMPYEEMSEILGTSVGALKASYHHAAKKIEQMITED
ncbi:MAG: RNA polymerase sigma factor [Chitinophagales bacterium]|nr:RNA polymerase sigma factor [Chitinophagales bacterium]